MVINGISMASDRYGAIGVVIKHVDTLLLNSSKALEFNSRKNKIHNQHRMNN